MTAPPVPLHPRRPEVGWWLEPRPEDRTRIVVPASALEQFHALPLPDVGSVAEPVYLDGATVEVLDLVSRKRWLLRRGQCGMGSCACDSQGWPADRRDPVPVPEVFDWWLFRLTPDECDALDSAAGQPVSEMGWPDALRVGMETWPDGPPSWQ